MTKLPRSLAALICAIVAVAFLATPVLADDEKDPPSRVARLKYMSGQVSFQPGGVNDWVDATLNRPLTTADRVWTDKDSKAELHLGTAALRMSNETSLTLINLTDNTVQMELDQGVLNVHVRKMYPGEIYEVDTPNVAFTLLKPGDYRFAVDAERDMTEVIVRKGKGEGNGDGRGVEVESGEVARFEHGNTLMHAIEHAPSPDGFDDWCRVRDQREDKGYESARYVSDDINGYEDLDDNGYWRPVPTYGNVWIPRTVVVGWAPYRYGHWAWIEPWGWTWVDNAPWGFAPFHYGRWIYSSYGWAWSPGPRVIRPVYAPALVAWFGGPHFGVGVSLGNVGWVPLGWGEPFYPYYRVSRGYVRNVNIANTHITNITYVTNNYTTIVNNHGKPIEHREYMNARGVSVVPNDAMIHSQRVDKFVRPFDGKDLNKAEFMHSPGVTPDRESVLGGGNHSVHVPQGVSDRRPVMSKLAPPERPTDFESRRPFIEKNDGMPVDRNLGARGTRGPEDRKPVATEDGPRGPRGGNGNRADNPTGPRAPEERKPVNVGEGSSNPDSGRHAVPRPPAERKPASVDESSPATRGASNDAPRNDGPRHVVPRPPADRQPAVGSDDRVAGHENNPQRVTPQVPQERKPVNTGDDRQPGRNDSRVADQNNPQRVTPQVPQERKPVNTGDEGRGSDRARPTPEERRRPADAEVHQQGVPKPPEREVKPPSERNNSEERRSAPKREEAPKPKPEPKPERESKPATPAGAGNRSSRYVSRPAMSASNGYRSSSSDTGYSRRASSPNSYASNSYARDSYSGRSYPASRPESRSMATYRPTSNYSGRSSGTSYRQSSPSSNSSRSSGGSYSHGSSGGERGHSGR